MHILGPPNTVLTLAGPGGDVIPCGDYVFDHRNASVREWLVNEVMLGLGHIVTLHHRPPTSHHPDSLTHPVHLFLTGQRGRTSQVMLGPMGLAHPAVDGFGCIDDWYAGIARVLRGDRGRGGGPSEV